MAGIRTLLLLTGWVAAGAAGAEGVLEFGSGGAHHPSGHGAWLVTVNTAGHFAVKHAVGDKTYDCGTFTLSQAENAELWELVARADVAGMSSSTRPGVPDEVMYSFRVTDGEGSHSAEVWKDDALKEKKVAALVDLLAALIAKYAGAKPILR